LSAKFANGIFWANLMAKRAHTHTHNSLKQSPRIIPLGPPASNWQPACAPFLFKHTQTAPPERHQLTVVECNLCVRVSAARRRAQLQTTLTSDHWIQDCNSSRRHCHMKEFIKMSPMQSASRQLGAQSHFVRTKVAEVAHF
jgi:hypothetical protein